MRAKWDQIAEKFFEGGCSKGMCYSYNPNATNDDYYDYGEPWNGISGFTDNPSGADEQAGYADNIKYYSLRGAENYGFTVNCFTYPDNFKKCLGKKTVVPGVTVSQQARETFGFAVTTQIGNDTEGIDAGETLHLVWNATTSPSSKDYSSLNESPSPSELSFEATANPIDIGTGYKPACNMEISTKGRKNDADFMGVYNDLLDILYGTDDSYTKLTGTEPADWPTTTTPSTKYFKNTGTESAPVYVGVTSADSYAANTYYQKTAATDPRLPMPAEIIEMFGDSVNDVTPEG